MEYCFGVDIGGTTVKIGLFSTDGTLLDKWEIPTRTENQGERILPDVAQALQNKMTERKIGSYEMRGDRDRYSGAGNGKRHCPENGESWMGLQRGLPGDGRADRT